MATARWASALRQIQRLFLEGILASLPDSELLERFLSGGDEAAFTALVERHGPMVLGTCRAVLRDVNAAEDAFQATFLVLVCKARSIRGRGALASWLYQVAHRIAIQASVEAARRRKRERLAGQVNATDGHHVEPDDEWREILHEELARLSDKYRLPLLLCDLEGKTHAQAAAELNCGEATVRRRLTGARELLRSRLIRRGLALTAGTLATSFGRSALAKVPPGWAEATVKAAARMNSTAARIAVAEIVSTTAAALARKSLHAMLLGQLRAAAASVVFLIAFVGLAWGVGIPGQDKSVVGQVSRMQSHQTARRPSPGSKPSQTSHVDPSGPTTYQGRVLGPDGRPVAGAKLYMTLAWGYPHEPSPSPEYATTGPDGRFQFAVPEAEFEDQSTVVAATAPNYGVGWVKIPPDGKRDDLTIRLADDDVPITGQIVDLEGKPVEGATLRLMQINAAPGEDLGPWLEAVKGKTGLSYELEQQYLKRFTIAVPLQVTTDSAGRFRLTGIGRNRLVTAQLDGPTIVSEHLHMLTRPGEMIEVTEYAGKPEYNDRAGHHVLWCRLPARGRADQADRRRGPRQGHQEAAGRGHDPEPRAEHRPSALSEFDLVRTTTDAQGRYRLTGMPKREGNQIVAIPDRDQPYVPIHKDVPDSPGLDPVTADIELKRGVWIEGKITDKVTGQPLRGAVEYFALYSNPNLRDFPGFDGTFLFVDAGVASKDDGSYRVVGLPGPGLVAVYPQRTTICGPPNGRTSTGPRRRPWHGSLATQLHEQLQRPRPDRPGQGGRFGEAGRDARPGLEDQGHGARAGRPAPGGSAELRAGQQ